MHLSNIIVHIGRVNPVHGKKLQALMESMQEPFFSDAEAFLDRYEKWLIARGSSMERAVDHYLQMLADVQYETVRFIQTGAYSSHSFEEVNQRVYARPEVMEYYMHGLLLSQFLWKHHYLTLTFFREALTSMSGTIASYLEVGGGHGLFLSEAIRINGGEVKYDLIDISEASLEMTRSMVGTKEVNFMLKDVFAHQVTAVYDWITMGEVLEHVEDPVALLKHVGTFLKPTGRLFLTTPTNAPAIDHIYLFRNADEIREVIHTAGLAIEQESLACSEDVSPEKAEKFKVSMMYAALLKKQGL
jgi:2-polyprenyl-3-methyl-5-hydroxy-6-metoxy-1,4-benzoquinol methylase